MAKPTAAPKPAKVEKKAPRPEGEKKAARKHRSTFDSYSTYIFKVLRHVHPDTGISKRAMSIMDSFVHDIFERIASEAGRIARYNKRHTITSREIMTAARLVLPGELAKHAVKEGSKAVAKFSSSQASQDSTK